jgi:hypothetical protein
MSWKLVHKFSYCCLKTEGRGSFRPLGKGHWLKRDREIVVLQEYLPGVDLLESPKLSSRRNSFGINFLQLPDVERMSSMLLKIFSFPLQNRRCGRGD